MAASVDGLTHVGVVAAAVAAATAALVCSMFAQAPAKLSPTKQNKPSSSECGARGTEQWVLPVRPKPTAPYPDIKRAGGFLFLAGASNREPSTGTADSGYFVGVQEMANGEVVSSTATSKCSYKVCAPRVTGLATQHCIRSLAASLSC